MKVIIHKHVATQTWFVNTLKYVIYWNDISNTKRRD